MSTNSAPQARVNIPISGPSISQKEIDYVADAVANAWYADANVYNEKFEKAFATYVGRRYAITLPSCTSGLHLALAALGVGHGDEVIVPDITWIATSAPISYLGATPVFADVDEKSWCITAESLERCVTAKTKAVILVDLYGNMPDMDSILAFASGRGIAVIEDAAEAIGSEYKGGKAGSFGQFSVFSFHGSKTLTTGEGGMLLTDDEQLYDRCMILRDHGRSRGKKMFWNDEVAFKYKMSSMQAALGLAQLERIEELVDGKRNVFEWYRNELNSEHGITLNYEGPEIKNTFWMVTAILDPDLNLTKEDLLTELSKKGISARPFFYPLSSLPAYQHLSHADCRNEVSYKLSPYGVNLPSALNLTPDVVHQVCDELKSIILAKR